LGVVEHAFNSSTQEAEAISKVPGHLGYVSRPFLKNKDTMIDNQIPTEGKQAT
jgi:ABC-type phosphate transport system substrate-binding protein